MVRVVAELRKSIKSVGRLSAIVCASAGASEILARSRERGPVIAEKRRESCADKRRLSTRNDTLLKSRKEYKKSSSASELVWTSRARTGQSPRMWNPLVVGERKSPESYLASLRHRRHAGGHRPGLLDTFPKLGTAEFRPAVPSCKAGFSRSSRQF
jgi:hypothetical protein